MFCKILNNQINIQFKKIILTETYPSSPNLWSLGRQSKCVPGTLKEVINIVKQRNKNTVPANAKKRRKRTSLYLCDIRTHSQMINKNVPVISHPLMR